MVNQFLYCMTVVLSAIILELILDNLKTIFLWQKVVFYYKNLEKITKITEFI